MNRYDRILTNVSRAFVRADFATVLAFFHYPAAIYFEDRVAPVATPCELLRLLRLYHSALTSAGVSDVEVEVVATSLPRNSKRSLWLKKTYLGADGREIDHSRVRYFFCASGESPRIQMLEYHRVPLRERLVALPIFRAA